MLKIEDIRAERARRGWTQEQLSVEAGVSYDTVKRIENPKISLDRANYGTIVAIATALGLTAL